MLLYSLTETTPAPLFAGGAGCHSLLSGNLLLRGLGLRQLGFSPVVRPAFEQIHLLDQALCRTQVSIRCIIFCVGFDHSSLTNVKTYPQGKKLIYPKPVTRFFTLPKRLGIQPQGFVALTQIVVCFLRKIFQIMQIFSCNDHLIMVSV